MGKNKTTKVVIWGLIITMVLTSFAALLQAMI